jgi:hypothetical protein
MTFVNTNGMAFIGPGSEWFWTAVSGLVLAVTFLAIYRQLRIARDASSYEQLVAFQNEVWSERMVRVELDVLVALRDAVPPKDLPPGAADILGGFWQVIGALARSGNLDPKLLGSGALGGVTFWWSALAAYAAWYRTAMSLPGFWGDFEWLAGRVIELDGHDRRPGWDDAEFGAFVTNLLEDRLRIEEALRRNPVRADRPLADQSRRPARSSSVQSAKAKNRAEAERG